MRFFKHLLLAINFLTTYPCWSQTISHIQQLPMHYNPSFAGEKDAGRLAGYTNIQNGYKSIRGDSFVTRSATAIAYDDHFLLKRIKIGVGLELFNLNINGNKAKNTHSASLNGIKLAIAPKFEIKIKSLKPFTFSPAIGYTFITSNEKFIKNERIFSDYVSADVKSSSNFGEIYYDFMPKRGQEVNFGFSLSRPSFTLAIGFSLMNYTVQYDWNRYYHTDSTMSNSSSKFQYQQTETSLSHKFQTYGYNIFLSKTFKMGRAKNFSLTPFFNGSSIEQYYIPITKKDAVGYRSQPYFINWGMDIVGMYAQYKKCRVGIMLVGGDYGELAVGYQHERFNVQLSVNQYLTGGLLLNDKLNGAVSLNYYLKRKKVEGS